MTLIFLSLVSLISFTLGDYDSFFCSKGGLIQQIDHVLLGTTSSSADNLANVYNILSLNLSFPIAWNYEYYDHDDVYKGGLSLSNLNIEFIYSPPNGINGMAFQPCSKDLMIIRSQFYNKNLMQNITESLTFNTTNEDQNYVGFGLDDIININLSNSNSTFFICNYLINQNLRRQYLWKQFAANNGGRLGIQYVEYVIINLNISNNNNKDILLQNWRNILFPYQLECDTNQIECIVNNFGGGPDLMIQINQNNKQINTQTVEMIIVKVRDINNTVSVLKELNLYSAVVPPPPFQNCIEMSFMYYNVETIAKLVFC